MQTEKNIWLRVLSMILTLALLISCVPNQVYAMAGEALADLMEREETGESIETSNQTKRGVYEVTELREANVKHFALEDGTYTLSHIFFSVCIMILLVKYFYALLRVGALMHMPLLPLNIVCLRKCKPGYVSTLSHQKFQL